MRFNQSPGVVVQLDSPSCRRKRVDDVLHKDCNRIGQRIVSVSNVVLSSAVMDVVESSGSKEIASERSRNHEL